MSGQSKAAKYHHIDGCMIYGDCKKPVDEVAIAFTDALTPVMCAYMFPALGQKGKVSSWLEINFKRSSIILDIQNFKNNNLLYLKFKF